MNASGNNPHIPWFNPREMADETVVRLATGRDELLFDFFEFVRQRMESPIRPTAGAHWLLTGQRGAGKSFFLRYVQIKVAQTFPNVRFVLLPEELRNVRAPHDLLNEIRRTVEGKAGKSAKWQTEDPEKSWEESLAQLLTAFSEPLLIVGIENFAQLFDEIFSDEVSASLLRKLMERETRILILATAVDGSFDNNYNDPFFQQFEKRILSNWNGDTHRKYLEKRARLSGCTPTAGQLARIDAYSRYTGGNARIAAIVAAAVLDQQDIVEASNDLNATIDWISDYYRDLLDELPKKSEILFDALIRDGEPCSQTQLAVRVGARQSDISKAFAKLLEVGYLHADRPKGQKETLYRVADRLFAEWYRMRHIQPGQRSRLAVMADLLADMISFKDKLRYVERFSSQGENADVRLMEELVQREEQGYREKYGIMIRPLIEAGIDPLDLEQRLKMGRPKENFLDLMEMFPSDSAMRKAKDDALLIAKYYSPAFGDSSYDGKNLAELVMGSLSLNTVEKLLVLRAIPSRSRFQWDELIEMFEYKKAEIVKLEKDDRERKYIQQSREINANEWKYPWLEGWRRINLKQIYGDWVKADYIIVRTAAYAVEWLARVQRGDKLASNTFDKLQTSIDNAFESGWLDECQQFLGRLLDVLPDTADCALERAILLYRQSCVFSAHNQEQKALQSAQKALALIADQAASAKRDKVYDDICERTGWSFGTLYRWPEALAAHQTALSLQINGFARAWHAGQAARYLWRLEGLASAWQWIQQQNFEQDEIMYCLEQLGDGVWDAQRVDGIPQAYAAGRELVSSLIEHANDPAWTGKLLLEKCIRGVFIDMLDIGVDLSVLQDLARDLPSFTLEAKALELLAGVLGRWFAELQPSGAVHKNTPPPDPDWSTTIAALNEELSFSARLRLGLTEAPRLSAEASNVFMRVLAFIK
ncbi:MAG: hypothetical protein FWF31_10680 [Desulfobulbus sp.]|nr:hypothetical protein [Desulfobulbus sp.]